VVMAYLGARDLIRAMQTCRALYGLGLPIFLRTARLNIQPLGSISCRYIFTDPTRCSHIIHLECNYSQLTQLTRDRRLTCNLLQYVQRIQHLDLTILAGDVMTIEVMQRIASLTELRHLVIQNMVRQPQPLLQLLEDISLPLETLTIVRLSSSTFPDTEPMRPIRALAKFSGTLRELELSGVGTTYLTLPREGFVFPLVTKLSWTSVDLIDVGAVVSTFPNLQHLHVYCLVWHVLGGLLPADQAVQCRERNREAQELHRWESLQSVAGTCICIWMLGLVCPVEKVDVSIDAPEVARNEHHHIKEIIADLRPSCLHLKLFIIPEDLGLLMTEDTRTRLKSVVLLWRGRDHDRNRDRAEKNRSRRIVEVATVSLSG
jgi:hypothetical protein